MKSRIATAVLLVSLVGLPWISGCARGEGRILSPELTDAQISSGEPVWVALTIRNPAREDATIGRTSQGIRGLRVTVVDSAGRALAREHPPPPPVDLLVYPVQIEPGGAFQDEWLLNSRFALDRPGKYSVQVTASPGWMRWGDGDRQSAQESHVLPLEVRPRDPERLREVIVRLAEEGCGVEVAPLRALRAAEALAWMEDPTVVEALSVYLGCAEPRVRVEAAMGLRRLGTPEAIERLIEAAESGDAELASIAEAVLSKGPARGNHRVGRDGGLQEGRGLAEQEVFDEN